MTADRRDTHPLRSRLAKAAVWMKKLPRLPTIMLGITLLLILIGPAIVPHDPLQPTPANVLEAPSRSHWFGTDGFGMDVFSRVITATRLDVGVAVAGVTVGAVGGSILGATVAYTGGWLDAVVQKGIEVLQSFPLFLFALALFAALGDNTFNLVVVMASISLPWYARVVRSVIAPLREAEFVKALQNAGASGPRIVVMELLPKRNEPSARPFRSQHRPGDSGHRCPRLHRSGRQAALPRVGIHDQHRRTLPAPGCMVGVYLPGRRGRARRDQPPQPLAVLRCRDSRHHIEGGPL